MLKAFKLEGIKLIIREIKKKVVIHFLNLVINFICLNYYERTHVVKYLRAAFVPPSGGFKMM